jgi:DNA-binding protein HU-beta
MTKVDVIVKIAKKTGMNKLDVQVVVEELFQLIQASMLTGESIHFKGFGKFLVKKRKQKIARNLSDNTAMVIKEHYVPSLKPYKAFVDQVKENFRSKEM